MAKNIQNGSAKNNNNNKPLTGSETAMERNVQMTTSQFGRTSSGSGSRSTMDDSAIKGCVRNKRVRSRVRFSAKPKNYVGTSQYKAPRKRKADQRQWNLNKAPSEGTLV